MRSFKDCKGADWDVEVTLGSLSLVSARTGIDLRHLVTEEHATLSELADPAKLFAVLTTLTESQRTQRGINDEAFGALLNDAELAEHALIAVTRATIDFFPSRSRPLMHQAFETVKRAGEAIRTRAIQAAELEFGSPEFARHVEANLIEQQVQAAPPEKQEQLRALLTPSPNAGDSAASSVSTRKGTRGGNST